MIKRSKKTKHSRCVVQRQRWRAIHYRDAGSQHITLDKKNKEHNLKKLSFTFVELPKFDQQRGKDIGKLSQEEKTCAR